MSLTETPDSKNYENYCHILALMNAIDQEIRGMFKYEIIIYGRNNDDAFVAEVPELPGCTAHRV